MRVDTIDLYEYFHVERCGAKGGFLTTCIRTPSTEIKDKKRPAMVVFPGGGYGFISCREGEPVALKFMSEGYASFVLDYSINIKYPTPLIEACMAIAYVRENAEEFCVDASKIAAVGFSAGGNLVGLLATLKDKEVSPVLGELVKYSHPDAVILSYPVVTMEAGITHEGTRSIISGNGELDLNNLSVEKRVTADSAPAFIWHTYEDNCVPVENSLLLASAYKNAGVPFALHIFEKGWHGLSLCNEEVNNQTPEDLAVSAVGKWVDLALDWLKARGFSVVVK